MTLYRLTKVRLFTEHRSMETNIQETTNKIDTRIIVALGLRSGVALITIPKNRETVLEVKEIVPMEVTTGQILISFYTHQCFATHGPGFNKIKMNENNQEYTLVSSVSG